MTDKSRDEQLLTFLKTYAGELQYELKNSVVFGLTIDDKAFRNKRLEWVNNLISLLKEESSQ